MQSTLTKSYTRILRFPKTLPVVYTTKTHKKINSLCLHQQTTNAQLQQLKHDYTFMRHELYSIENFNSNIRLVGFFTGINILAVYIFQ